MSATARHHSKRSLRACQSCQARKARFRYRGDVKSDRDHTLCFECYRAERERRRAARLADDSDVSPQGELPFGHFAERQGVAPASTASLSENQARHRNRMLHHLEAEARRARRTT